MGWGLRDYNRTGRIKVCFKDRFTAKEVVRYSGTGPTTNTSVCPMCREPLTNMGKDFRPPRKDNDREWKRIEVALRLGYGYWRRQTPRQLSLIAEKRNRVLALNRGLRGRQTHWRWYNYDPELM